MFNHCPNCQSRKIIFVEQRYFQCPDCDFCYFHNIAAAVAAIIQYQDKILLTTRAKQPGQGLLDLPGGFVDANESLEQALSREVQEELGICITAWQYFVSLPNVYQYKNITYHTLDSVFLTTLAEPPKLTLEASEISDSTWLNVNDIDLEKIAFPSLRQAISLLQQQES